jgi:hypothetical protein
MSKLKVFPIKYWDLIADRYQEFPDRFATLEKIEKIKAEPIEEAGIEVDDDQVHGGWYVEREYKGHLFHIPPRDSGYVIYIYGSDGKPAKNTAPHESALEALLEARKIVDSDK